MVHPAAATDVNDMTTKTAIPIRRFIVDACRVLGAAHALNGDRSKCLHWFMTAPIAEFGKLIARELVMRGSAQVVLDYIESISAGATS